MYQPAQRYGDDSDSLQADVMRFMAIIAFCLIAILALVKNTEPAETSAEEPTAHPPVEPAATSPSPWQTLSTAETQPVELPVVELALTPEPPAPEPEIEPKFEPKFEPEPVPEPVHELQSAPESVTQVAASTPPAAPAEVPKPAADAPEEPESEEGLVLRFASDGDFLRLIAKGDIRVYAFQDTDVLTLNPSYRFLDTKSPGQVYELLPPSIPGLIVDALKQARADTDGFRWGIALPGHISNQIEQHLGQVTRGQLVIDRYGDVRHVAAS